MSHLNPPAFPRSAFYPDDPADHLEPGERLAWSHSPQAGMTLLDWFAGQALGGYLAAHSADGQALPGDSAAAKCCYEYAAAMLAERARLAARVQTPAPAADAEGGDS